MSETNTNTSSTSTPPSSSSLNAGAKEWHPPSKTSSSATTAALKPSAREFTPSQPQVPYPSYPIYQQPVYGGGYGVPVQVYMDPYTGYPMQIPAKPYYNTGKGYGSPGGYYQQMPMVPPVMGYPPAAVAPVQEDADFNSSAAVPSPVSAPAATAAASPASAATEGDAAKDSSASEGNTSTLISFGDAPPVPIQDSEESTAVAPTANATASTDAPAVVVGSSQEAGPVLSSNIEIEEFDNSSPVPTGSGPARRGNQSVSKPGRGAGSGSGSAATPSREEWARKKASSAAAAGGLGDADGADDQWRKAADSGLSIADVLALKDNVIRYSKLQLLRLNKKNRLPPANIRSFYEWHSQTQRIPRPPKGYVVELKDDDTPHADEEAIFRKDKGDVFRFDVNRLADTENPEVIMLKTNLVLNRISPTNFDKLSDELLTYGIQRPDVIERVVEAIVLKAQLEEVYCFLYADLCVKIIDRWMSEEAPAESSTTAASSAADNDGGADTSVPSLGKAFRVKLLSRCQREFDIDRTSAIEAIQASSEAEDVKIEKEIILKKRYVGHMRFIGELFMKDLFTTKTMISCIEMLAASDDDQNILCLCKLFITIGHKLETKQKVKHQQAIDAVFKNIDEVSRAHGSSRIRFLLKDLIELRKKGWQPRREAEKVTKIGPAADTPQPSPMPQQSGAGGGGGGSTGRSPRSATQFQDVRKVAAVAAPSPQAPPADDEWAVVGTKSKKAAPVPAASGSKTPGGGASSSAASGPRSGAGGKAAGGPTGKSAFSALDSPDRSRSNRKGSGRESVGRDGGRDGGRDRDRERERESSAGHGGGHGNSKGLKGSQVLSVAIPADAAAGSEASPASASEAATTVATPAQDQICVDGVLDKDAQKKARASLEEFIVTNDSNEVLQDFVLFHPSVYPELFKYLVNRAVNLKEQEARNKFNEFIAVIFRANLFTSESITEGVKLFLHELDDTSIDVPKAAPYFATILAFLASEGVVDLSLLSTLPEDNDFSISPRLCEFVVNVFISLANFSGVESAQNAFTSSNIVLSKLVQVEDDEDPNEQVARVLASRPLPFSHE